MITITVMDDIYSPVTVTLMVEVEILNNNAPVLSFGGHSMVVYVEGDNVLLVGALMQPAIVDADNNGVFNMEQATVSLIGAVDGESEQLAIGDALPIGISVTGKM